MGNAKTLLQTHPPHSPGLFGAGERARGSAHRIAGRLLLLPPPRRRPRPHFFKVRGPAAALPPLLRGAPRGGPCTSSRCGTAARSANN